jgi:hypothetical protein
MSLDLPLSVRVEEWRRKAAEGSITPEEMRECIAAIRNGRVSASVASAKSRSAKAPVDMAALDDEIDNL